MEDFEDVLGVERLQQAVEANEPELRAHLFAFMGRNLQNQRSHLVLVSVHVSEGIAAHEFRNNALRVVFKVQVTVELSEVGGSDHNVAAGVPCWKDELRFPEF